MLGRRRLGRTGIQVSLLGFGGIPIMRVGQREASRAVRAALDAGIDFFDTARRYGDSERKIGRALRGLGGDVVLASKSPSHDRSGLIEDFKTSLRELAVDKIDIYQLHCINTEQAYETCMAEGGAYEVAIEHASEMPSVRQVVLGGEPVAGLETVPFAATGAWRSFIKAGLPEPLMLKPGRNVVRFVNVAGSLNFKTLEFIPVVVE